MLAAVLGAALLQASAPETVPGDGRLFDLALGLRARLAPRGEASPPTPVAVIAIDARSLATPPLDKMPRALFAPVWARLVTGLAAAGAEAIAFDVLLSFSGEAIAKGYDRSFQRALHANRERVVLGRSAETLPDRRYLAPLRAGKEALGLLEIGEDTDGVVRRFTLVHRTRDGARLDGLAAAALARAGRGELPETIIPAPRRHPERLPTYALIDLLSCAATAPETLPALFRGRLVFVGSVLAEEDRRRPSARLLPAPEAHATSPACPPAPLGASAPMADTVPGVHLHAGAAEAVLNGEWVDVAPSAARIATAAFAALLGALLGLWLAPWIAALLVPVVAVLAWPVQAIAIEAGYWLPTALPILALVGSAILAYVVRYLVEERRRRAIQRAFGHFLAPSLVDEMVEDPKALSLGGEARDVTIMFADLSGFTALSTMVGPEELMRVTNHYLALIADEVDASGGYVDKFIGDAVMAIWGAPVADEDHAHSAVAAALRMALAIEATAAEAVARGEHGFGIKIGLHSGPAIVGNVGSERRYNYTAVGETVNIASRLEGLPGIYGCPLLVGDTTRDRLSERVLLRELDRVVVKGRERPVPLHEPLAALEAASADDRARAAGYEAALADYRARRFAEAATTWRALGPDDGPAAVMAKRAESYRAPPPPENWDGVFVMTGK